MRHHPLRRRAGECPHAHDGDADHEEKTARRPAHQRHSDRTLYVGQFLGAVGMALMGWATSSFLFMVGVTVMSMWALSGPAAQGMMTHRVSASEQGEFCLLYTS